MLFEKVARALILGVILTLAAPLLYIAIKGAGLGGDLLNLPTSPNKQTESTEDVSDVALPDVNPDITQFGLEIPSLSIKAPVVPAVDGLNERGYHVITAKLGVAHLKGSQYPDQKGNTYLFGHSSFWLNYPGQYKELLRPLDQLKKDEKFLVYYKGTPYEYTVFANKVVEGDDFSVLDPTPEIDNDYTVTLQTSWPPGTALKRRVVFGRREVK